MNSFKTYFFVLVFTTIGINSIAQINENTWLNHFINIEKNKWTLSLRVTERLDVDVKKIEINRHINTFTDLALTRSLPKNFSIKLLTRRFFNPKPAKDVSFIWVDVIHKFTYKTITIKNLIRYHGGLDLHENQVADFIRYIPNIAYKYSKSSSIFIQSDVFFQLNNLNKPTRIRYQTGINHKLNKTSSISVQYWREPSLNISPKIISNIYVFTLAHKFKL